MQMIILRYQGGPLHGVQELQDRAQFVPGDAVFGFYKGWLYQSYEPYREELQAITVYASQGRGHSSRDAATEPEELHGYDGWLSEADQWRDAT